MRITFLCRSSILLLIFCIFLFNGICWSESDTRAGRIEIKPSFSLTETYDDNIYLLEENEVDSYITVVSPGISLSVPLKKHLFKIGYGAEAFYYSEESEINDATHQKLSSLIDLDFPVGLSFKFKGDYLDTTAQPYSELIERVKYRNADLQAIVGYEFSRKLSFQINQLYRSYDYYESVYYENLLNRRENESALTIFYRFLRKTSFLAGYDVGQIKYEYEDSLNDSKYTQAWIGAKGKIAPKTEAILRIGQQSREYTEREDEDRDFSGSMVRIGSLTDFSPRTSLEVTLLRQIAESIYADNLYYTSTRGELKLSQRIAKKWNLVLGGLYEQNAYPEESTEDDVTQKRTDDIIGADIDLRYHIHKWLSWGIRSQFKKRDSNFDAYDYEVNRFSGDVIDYMLEIRLVF